MRAKALGILIVLLGAVPAGCGGDEDGAAVTTMSSGPATSAAADPSTTVAAATTTLPRTPLPAAEPTAVGRAQRGLLTMADLGASWVEFRPATGQASRDVRATSRLGCALQPTGPVPPASLAALVDGAILQRGTAKRYATSSTLAFTDEAGARAAVEALRSPAWSTCRVDDKTREARAEPAGAVDPRWRVEPVEDTGRGQGGFEGLVRFQFQAVVDGKLVDANGYETVLIYRIGRIVVLAAAEGQIDPADPPDIEKALNDEMTAAIRKALARLG